MTHHPEGKIDFIVAVTADKAFDDTVFDVSADYGSQTDTQNVRLGIYELPTVTATLLTTELMESDNATQILECTVEGNAYP